MWVVLLELLAVEHSVRIGSANPHLHAASSSKFFPLNSLTNVLPSQLLLPRIDRNRQKHRRRMQPARRNKRPIVENRKMIGRPVRFLDLRRSPAYRLQRRIDTQGPRSLAPRSSSRSQLPESGSQFL